jgi:hypothetical protein
MTSALLLDARVPAGAEERAALLRRFGLAGVAVVLLGDGPADGVRAVVPWSGWTPRGLLAAVRAGGGDPTVSWLVCGDAAAVPAAASAGLAGVVLVGCAVPPGDHALVVAAAAALADAPRVMVPRAGGCWHGR